MAQKRSANGVRAGQTYALARVFVAGRGRGGATGNAHLVVFVASSGVRTAQDTPRNATTAALTGEESGWSFEEGGTPPTGARAERGRRQRVKQAPRIGQAQNGKAKPQASRDARWERGVLSAQGASNERLLEPRGEG
ncbi:hypothetical protein ERJ75_000612700 [Trypanosoma vivax]|nr:hypothetical protein ERJ75_000612700 [Trypanosoma vivax]